MNDKENRLAFEAAFNSVDSNTDDGYGCHNWQATCWEIWKHAIAAMKAKSDAEVVWPSCQTCGGKTVCIRGRYPDQPGREVCPTCLAERMDTIREVADRDYGRAYQAAPLDLAKKIGEVK